jgi:hypothetical protein
MVCSLRRTINAGCPPGVTALARRAQETSRGFAVQSQYKGRSPALRRPTPPPSSPAPSPNRNRCRPPPAPVSAGLFPDRFTIAGSCSLSLAAWVSACPTSAETDLPRRSGDYRPEQTLRSFHYAGLGGEVELISLFRLAVSTGLPFLPASSRARSSRAPFASPNARQPTLSHSSEVSSSQRSRHSARRAANTRNARSSSSRLSIRREENTPTQWAYSSTLMIVRGL